jgi:tripartite-type tricarboxylate transporter receptor subunit TctC
MSEAGLEGYETTVSFGLVAPAGTPTAIVARLHDAAAKVLADKELQAKLQAQGFDLLPIGSPEDYAAQIKADIAKWVPIVKASGASTN